MNQKALLEELDQLAGQLSGIANQLNRLRVEMTPARSSGKKRPTGITRQRWTESDKEIAIKMAQEGETPEAIATALGRENGAGSVMSMLNKILPREDYVAYRKAVA